MTAKDVISPLHPSPALPAPFSVEADTPLVDVLHRLLEAPGRELAVVEHGEPLGVIDQTAMLEGLGRMIAPRDDSSVVVVECPAADYSASRMAHAVEDSDAHLVDMWSVPSADGRVSVTLRVRHTDPTSVVHNLERYGYDVVSAHGSGYVDADVATERLLALQMMLNV